jgi:lipopolysaccharide/colanic/teichoic acid biosynthesis glycosyltransferase
MRSLVDHELTPKGDRREDILRRMSRGRMLRTGSILRLEFKRLLWQIVVRSTKVIKRGVDILISAVALLVLAPVFMVVALMIRLDSPGLILFKQTRVGQWGKLFSFWKLRSMFIDAEQRKAAMVKQNEMKGGVIFKMKEDPRITRIGKFLRRGSIDELPQLWNVLKGDMSLVGPRPPLPSEVQEYTLADRRRLEAIPGITCLWQVMGRSAIPFSEQVELDAAYIESQSLRQDLTILLKTIPAVLSGRGAY